MGRNRYFAQRSIIFFRDKCSLGGYLSYPKKILRAFFRQEKQLNFYAVPVNKEFAISKSVMGLFNPPSLRTKLKMLITFYIERAKGDKLIPPPFHYIRSKVKTIYLRSW